MSLLSSTVNDDEELVDDNKENNEGCSVAKNAESNKIGSGSVGRGQHRRPWKLLSSSSDEALHQRSSEQPHRSVGHQQPHRSAGHNHPPAPGGVFAASVDRILIPLGSSPVLNVRNGAGNSATITGNGATITGSGAVKESRLRDVEPLLAASPNILGKSGPRVIHAKPNGHPMGTVYCIAYTPPNRNRLYFYLKVNQIFYGIIGSDRGNFARPVSVCCCGFILKVIEISVNAAHLEIFYFSSLSEPSHREAVLPTPTSAAEDQKGENCFTRTHLRQPSTRKASF